MPPGEQTLVPCPQEQLRNICILAHVDHGKTTAADNLICSNGIISRHSAGKIRYLDSRDDEQERLITMKSSSISLRWASSHDKKSYMANLIDSPGHVDFTSEVSTAARLADGAYVLVDVIEGVEAQTRTVLRQAWRDRVKTCLVLNKVDRLIVELELTAMEAYQRLVRIIEQINAVNQQLLSEDVMAKDKDAQEDGQGQGSLAGAQDIDLSSTLAFDDKVEEAWRYSPERGNVAFASATHGWAFRVDSFAPVIAAKMGANPKSLQKVLWGDWTFNKKTRRAQRWNPSDSKAKPMFVEFVLQQVFNVYEATYRSINLEQLTKMQSQIAGWKAVSLESLAPGAGAVRELTSRWLPFADCVLQMAAEHLPSPVQAIQERLPVLCPRWFAAGTGTGTGTGSAGAGAETGAGPGAIAEGMQRSDPSGPVVAYLAKFLAADLERRVLTGDALVGEEELQFVGICRVFSGTLKPGAELFITREDSQHQSQSQSQSQSLRVLRVEALFQLMGRFLEDVPEAASGSIVAVQVRQVAGPDFSQEASRSGSSEIAVERCLTLCESAEGPCLETPYSSQAFAIVRVSILPQNVCDLDALDRGLRLLHRADPSVSVEVMVTGENVLGCCGDEHLKRCTSDLQKVYARGVPLSISKPLVAVRESIAKTVPPERIDPKASVLFLPIWAAHLAEASTEASSQLSAPLSEHEEGEAGVDRPQDRVSMSHAGIMSVWTANRKACFRVSATALPAEVLTWMDEHAEELESVVHRRRPSVALAGGREVTLEECLGEISAQFQQRLAEAGPDAASCVGSLCGMSVAKGSRVVLLDATPAGWTLQEAYRPAAAATAVGTAPEDLSLEQACSTGSGSGSVPSSMRASVLSGFQLAANAGPLCEEPMRGVAFVLHSCHVVSGEEAAATAGGLPALVAVPEPYGPMSGQVMCAMKEACRYCLFRRGFARICEVMLALEVQCEQAMLGKVYAELGRRRVKVLDEGLREGTSLFYINAYLPLADSFGLSAALRGAASGNVSFHCAFSHWEQSEEDPFQEATMTAEELEELGDQPCPPNTARKLVDAIRKRKGLPTDEKVVRDATKQRTVTRMK